MRLQIVLLLCPCLAVGCTEAEPQFHIRSGGRLPSVSGEVRLVLNDSDHRYDLRFSSGTLLGLVRSDGAAYGMIEAKRKCTTSQLRQPDQFHFHWPCSVSSDN